MLPHEKHNTQPLEDLMLIWGTNYYFTLVFDELRVENYGINSAGESDEGHVPRGQHQFGVTHHWNNRFYMLTHTSQQVDRYSFLGELVNYFLLNKFSLQSVCGTWSLVFRLLDTLLFLLNIPDVKERVLLDRFCTLRD